MGLSEFGIIGIATAHTLFIHYLSSFGLEYNLPNQKSKVVRNFIALLFVSINLLLGAASFLTVYSLGLYLSVGLSSFILSASLLQMFLSGAGAILSGWLRAEKKYNQLIIKDQILLPFGALFSSTAIFIFYSPSADTYLTSYICFLIVCVAYAMSILIKAILGMLKEMNINFYSFVAIGMKGFSNIYFKQSGWLAIMATLESLIPWGTIFICAYYLSSEDIGLLSLLLRLAPFAGFLALSIAPILSGELPSLVLKSINHAGRLTQLFSFISVSWAINLLLIILLFGSPILDYFQIDNSDSLLPVLFLLCLAFSIDALGGMLKYLLISTKDGNFSSFSLCFGCAILIPALLILNSKMDILNVSYVLLISLSTVCILRIFRIYLRYKIFPLNISNIYSFLKGASLSFLALIFSYLGFINLPGAIILFSIGTLFWVYIIFKDMNSLFTNLKI
jgi:O-antigen/teichoic acid export membrane protein